MVIRTLSLAKPVRLERAQWFKAHTACDLPAEAALLNAVLTLNANISIYNPALISSQI